VRKNIAETPPGGLKAASDSNRDSELNVDAMKLYKEFLVKRRTTTVTERPRVLRLTRNPLIFIE
jgi:hypothetical protein